MMVKTCIPLFALMVASLIIPSSMTAPVTFDQSTDDIEFDMPDITADYSYPSKTVTLKAFKVRNKTSTEAPRWVSVGYPTILNQSDDRLYQSTPENIRFSIRTLTDSQKEELVKAANLKYRNANPVNADNFARLPLNSFTCSLDFYVGGVGYTVRGAVYDLGTNPFALEFPLADGSDKRKAFEDRLKSKDSLFLKCEMSATGKQEQINTLTITRDQMQQIGVQDKLFGPATEVYVTRNQLTDLSQDIKSSLHIEETYEIEGEDFSEQFISKVLDITSATFQMVPIDEALTKLSKYFLSSNPQDLTPDTIKKEVNNVLEIKKEGDLEHIVLTDSGSKHYPEAKASQTGGSVGVSGLWKVINLTGSANFANQKSSDWASSHLSIDDQLRQLNRESENSIQWERDGNRVIPKSLDLAKITRMAFSQTMDFSRIKKRITSAKFHETPEIGLGDLTPAAEQVQLQVIVQALQIELSYLKAMIQNDTEKLWTDYNGYKNYNDGERGKIWNNINGHFSDIDNDRKNLWGKVNYLDDQKNQLWGKANWLDGQKNQLWDKANHNECRIKNMCDHKGCGHC